MTDVSDLNLLGRYATKKIGISVDEVLHSRESCNAVFDHLMVDGKLRNDCKKLCEDFPELWKPGLGCLKDVELEVEFKKDAQPYSAKQDPFQEPYKMTWKRHMKKEMLKVHGNTRNSMNTAPQ